MRPRLASPIRRSIRQGATAAWQNLTAMAVLLAAMAAILVLYYTCPPAAAFIGAFGAWVQAGGTVRIGLSAACAGGILAQLSIVYFRDGGRWTRQSVEDMVYRFVLYFISGSVVSEFYRLQAHWFGDGLNWRVVVPKVLVDQLGYSVFISTPYYAIAFRWQTLRFSFRRLWPELTPGFIVERMLPVVIMNWMFWIPGVTLVYCMPLPLQMPLNIFATAIWSVLVGAIATDTSADAKTAVPIPGLPTEAAPAGK